MDCCSSNRKWYQTPAAGELGYAMWYRMPMEDEALKAASDAELHRCLAALRCAAVVLEDRDIAPGDKELGRIILAHLDRAEQAARRR